MTIKTLPISTNRLYRGRRFLTSEGKANKLAVAWEVQSQWRGKPLECPVRLEIELWWPDARRRDLDNVKGLLDSFTGILYVDDSQIQELSISKGIDRSNPRIEVRLQERLHKDKRPA